MDVENVLAIFYETIYLSHMLVIILIFFRRSNFEYKTLLWISWQMFVEPKGIARFKLYDFRQTLSR